MKDKNPKPGSLWKHRNGLVYKVLFITNADSADEKYPPTVVYVGRMNKKLWSGPLSDWHRRMTEIDFSIWCRLGFHLWNASQWHSFEQCKRGCGIIQRRFGE